MHSLINNQLKRLYLRYWSESQTTEQETSQWYSVVLFHGTILSGSKGGDYFEIKSIVTTHAVNYNSSERLFQMFNPHASLCFILFVFFFPAHFSLHRLLSIWTAAKGNSGMIAWIYHNVKLFAKKRLDMSSGVTVVSVEYHQIRLQTSSFFSAFAKKIHKTFEALA